MIRSKKITQSARGESCTVLSPACNGNPETTVWAHSPFKHEDGGGMSIKPHDIFGCYACSSCHDWLDGRIPAGKVDSKYEAFHLAMKRSWLRLIDKGIIEVK